MALTKVPSNLDATIATTQSQADNSTNIATTAYVDLAVSNLSDSAPAALNTLNEIAAALGDDANYASTTTAAIAAKLPLAGGTMTGNLTVNAIVDADNFKINGGQGSDGQVLTSTGSGVAWEAVAGYADSDVESYLDGGTSTPILTNATIGGMMLKNGTGGQIGLNRNPYSGAYVGSSSLQRFQINGPMSGSDFLDFQSYNSSGTYTGSVYLNAGNVGIGATPKAYHSDYKAIDINNSASVMGYTGNNGAWLMENLYYGTDNNWKHKNSDFSALVGMYDGVFNFYNTASGTAGATATLQRRLKIDQSGNVGIGQDAPATTLHIGDGASHYVRIENAGSGDVSSGYQIYRGSSVGMSLYDNPADNMTSLLCAGGLNINAGGSGADLHVASNGKVGIGTTQPGERLHVEGSMMLDAYNVGAEEGLFFREGFSSSNRYNMGIMSYAHNGSTLDGITIGAYNGFSVCTGSNSRQERMRINDNGTLMIGSSTNPSFPHKLYASGNAITNGTAFFEDTDVSCGLANVVLKLSFSNDADCTNASFIYMTDSNNVLGSVGAASGTSVNFSSSSDERLKENIVDASSQLDVINNIQVREFDWKSNSHHELGLIAQEINTTIPNVVREGGDNVAEHPWSVDYGKLTPYIIKAFQEQQTIIEDLKSRIETLEG